MPTRSNVLQTGRMTNLALRNRKSQTSHTNRLVSESKIEVSKLMHNLDAADFRAICYRALEVINDPKAQHSTSAKNSLYGYLSRVALMQLDGEPTTKTEIATRSEAHPNNVKSAMTRLEKLGLVTVTIVGSETGTTRATYTISQKLIKSARALKKK